MKREPVQKIARVQGATMVDIHSAVSSVLTNKRRIGALKKLGVVTIADAIGITLFARLSVCLYARLMILK